MSALQELILDMPFDGHHHFRAEDEATSEVRTTTPWCGGAIGFGNIRMYKPPLFGKDVPPPVLTAADKRWYKAHLRERLPPGEEGFVFRTPICLTNEFTTPDMILEAAKESDDGAKVYPQAAPDAHLEGAVMTTNAEYGVWNYRTPQMEDNWKACEESGTVVHLHLERHGAFCLDREEACLGDLAWLHQRFPRLKIIVEHVSSKAAVDRIRTLGDNVRGSITLHHLFLTLDDVVGGMLQPHNFCKPIAKRPSDRYALRDAVRSGDPKFHFGSDSARHKKGAKEAANGCAGVYTSVEMIPMFVELAEEQVGIERLNPFLAHNLPDFLGIPRLTGKLQLVRERWQVPEIHDGIVPWMHGQRLDWKVVGKLA